MKKHSIIAAGLLSLMSHSDASTVSPEISNAPNSPKQPLGTGETNNLKIKITKKQFQDAINDGLEPVLKTSNFRSSRTGKSSLEVSAESQKIPGETQISVEPEANKTLAAVFRELGDINFDTQILEIMVEGSHKLSNRDKIFLFGIIQESEYVHLNSIIESLDKHMKEYKVEAEEYNISEKQQKKRMEEYETVILFLAENLPALVAGEDLKDVDLEAALQVSLSDIPPAVEKKMIQKIETLEGEGIDKESLLSSLILLAWFEYMRKNLSSRKKKASAPETTEENKKSSGDKLEVRLDNNFWRATGLSEGEEIDFSSLPDAWEGEYNELINQSSLESEQQRLILESLKSFLQKVEKSGEGEALDPRIVKNLKQRIEIIEGLIEMFENSDTSTIEKDSVQNSYGYENEPNLQGAVLDLEEIEIKINISEGIYFKLDPAAVIILNQVTTDYEEYNGTLGGLIEGIKRHLERFLDSAKIGNMEEHDINQKKNQYEKLIIFLINNIDSLAKKNIDLDNLGTLLKQKFSELLPDDEPETAGEDNESTEESYIEDNEPIEGRGENSDLDVILEEPGRENQSLALNSLESVENPENQVESMEEIEKALRI